MRRLVGEDRRDGKLSGRSFDNDGSLVFNAFFTDGTQAILTLRVP